MSGTIAASIDEAAAVLGSAEALLIAAGAGMGVDSGLPDFRGPSGFWTAYPPFAALGLSFSDLANPRWFSSDPELAWGFYGHRLNLYRETVPHRGFEILRNFSRTAPFGSFVFTSNVDGQFQAAGFPDEAIVECHGSIHYLQCSGPCHPGIWPTTGVTVVVDPETMRAAPPVPRCGKCGRIARPNILMFGDWNWIESRTEAQEARFDHWLKEVGAAPLAVIEIGAGTAVPTVRRLTGRIAMRPKSRLIRINPHEPEVPPGHISIPLSALDALTRLERAVSIRGKE